MAMNDYFDAHASEWEKMRRGYFDESIRKEAIRACLPTKEMTVADIGCGSGYMTEGLAPLVKRVIAIDTSSSMLDELKKRLNFNNIAALGGDMENIPLSNESVDAVFGNMVLHHAPHPGKAIGECARILRKGGMLILTDMDEHHNEWMREEMADVWLGFARQDVKAWVEMANLEGEVGCVGSCCGASARGENMKISVFIATGRKV
jgi:ubiquinone/menaquinone biosynthesis C-methylase UbiE